VILLLLALQQPQQPGPSVGDTIWLERAVVVPAGAQVRPAQWKPEGDIALLGRPVLRQEGGRTIVAYPAVAWTPGSHRVTIPGPVIIRADGATDSLPPEDRTVDVVSVLPPGTKPDQLPVQPEAGIVNDRITTLLPLLATLGIATLLFLPVAWWWRRRGPPMRITPPTRPERESDWPAWVENGEPRAVAAASARQLRQALLAHLPAIPAGAVGSRITRIVSELRPAWPAEEVGGVLRGLEAAEFGDVSGDEILPLVARAEHLIRMVASETRPPR